MRLILLLVTVLLSTQAFTQASRSNEYRREYYLQKSKRQKSTAFGLLIGGTVGVTAGLLIGDGHNSSFSDAVYGALLAGAGGICVLASIPVFISSENNKRKATLIVQTNPIRYPLPNRGNHQVQVGLSIAL